MAPQAMVRNGFVTAALELADTPELVDRLIQTHVPGPNGYCRAHDAHRERHPCSIRRLADMARTLSR